MIASKMQHPIVSGINYKKKKGKKEEKKVFTISLYLSML